MASASTATAPPEAEAASAEHRWRRRGERALPLLFLLPSVVVVGVFVYGFIGWTGYVSLSNWTSFVRDLSFRGFDTYTNLFGDFRFQADMRNVVVFTFFFVGACLILGLGLAMLIDREPKGKAVFRNLYLFPMALAFVVTGVIWQWLLNPTTGVNILLEALGWDSPPLWYLSTTIIPGWELGQIEVVVPVALLALVVAAVWQMSGFAMALYLAGLQGIPDEQREAARVDGASEWQVYRRVLLPQLRPITITIIIILGHISMKTFDLVVAMTGPGSGFVTDVPGLYMFQTTFRGNQFAKGAAIAVIMLIFIALLVVPHMVSQARSRTDEA